MPDAPQRSLFPISSTPRATYRLQFHKGFPFSSGRDLAPYLNELGVSHVYSSPILTARAGSIHGYDVVRYDEINPELGGEAAFREMAAALRAQGIGVILDIVPNHVAVGGDDNPMWLDLLKHGPASPYASWFDVDFERPDTELHSKVHAPFLGEPYRTVLEAGQFSLVDHPGAGGYAVAYGEHLFPIRPEDEAEIAAAGLEAYADQARLDALIAKQNYVLDWWRNAGDRINWRRFFDITQLAAIRMEEPAAFEAKHELVLRLYREGVIDGLRIDHVDGLADPAAYCHDLRAELDARQSQRPADAPQDRAWLVIEKILAPGELIPEDWDVDGSTGYDFMDQVSALQHQPEAVTALSAHWAVISGRPRDFHDEEETARNEILADGFDGQRERLLDALEQAGAQNREDEGLTRQALRRAVAGLIAKLRAYRSYATGRDDGTRSGAALEAALEAALATPLSDEPALRFIVSVIDGEGDEALRPFRITAIRRFNQLAAPLAAKAVEDTAFYRYGRLLSRNDVGFDAASLGMTPDDFHALMTTRATHSPHAMLATATHDHKRGEDVRARLAVLSEMPEEWTQRTEQWRELNAEIRPDQFDPGDEYMFYQMVVGAWPLGLDKGDETGLSAFAERLVTWWRKALREGKLRSGWAAPAEAYENDAAEFAKAALSPALSAAFLADAAGFVAALSPAGALNGLAQVTLRCMVPGVPDTYQGTEYWDFSLVDPDNRRPVDFSARRIALAQHLTLDLLSETWRDGRIKQSVLRKLLAFRQNEPDLFAEGSYESLEIRGPRQENAIAFLRRHGERVAVVIAARCCAEGLNDAEALAPEAAWWGDTHVVLPAGLAGSRAIIGPEIAPAGRLDLAEALPIVPVGVWAFGPTA